jgi:hypothetical protein
MKLLGVHLATLQCSSLCPASFLPLVPASCFAAFEQDTRNKFSIREQFTNKYVE